MKTDENNSKHNMPYPSKKCFEHNINPNDNRNIHEIGKMRLRKQNPYLFLMIWTRNEALMRFENGFTESLGRR